MSNDHAYMTYTLLKIDKIVLQGCVISNKNHSDQKNLTYYRITQLLSAPYIFHKPNFLHLLNESDFKSGGTCINCIRISTEEFNQ